MHPFDVTNVNERLKAAGGGYDVVHESPGLEVGVYVLVAPEPDGQQPHADDELYVVLEGSGTLEVEGTATDLREGHALFVAAGAEHRFTGYEGLLRSEALDVNDESRSASSETIHGSATPTTRIEELSVRASTRAWRPPMRSALPRPIETEATSP